MNATAPSTPAPEKKPSLLARLGPAGILGLLWGTLPALGGIFLLARIDYASEWLRSHGAAESVFVYTSIFIVSAGLGFLPTYAQSILAGWVFGIWLGIPAALTGFGGAAMIGYAIARYVSKDRVEKVINEKPKARAVRDALIRSGFWRSLLIVTLVRIPPNSPFALTNGVLAASGVRLLPYTIGTVIGMTPRTAAAVILANHWASEGAKNIQEAVRERGFGMFLFGIVTFFIVLGVIGFLANKAIAKVTEQQAADSAAAEAP
ncbi:MAG: TVP38/TMEM64 family protein [Phycisphaerales bacterium]